MTEKIENKTVALNPNSQARQDAKGIIQYTLMLDYKCPDIDPSDLNYIPAIMDSTMQCCNSLINSGNYMQYNFFGSNTSYSPENLIYLNHYPVPYEKKDLPHDISISKLLVQNSLMMAYHAILTEYLSDCDVTAYQIAIRLKGAGAHKAMHLQNIVSAITIQDEQTKFLGLPKERIHEDSRLNSSIASTFYKKYRTKLENFSALISFTIMEEKEESSAPPKTSFRYGLQYAPLCMSINQAKASDFFRIFSTQNNNFSSDAKWEALTALATHFTPRFSSPSIANQFKSQANDHVDGIYEFYLAEKSYCLNLFKEILELISQTEERTDNRYSFRNAETLEILAKCKKLPCPFIRRYLLRFAFDHINNETNSYQDYWDEHDFSTRNNIANYVKRPKGFQYDRWLRQYELFIDYLSDYIIPVYDWCFICMLLEGVEKAHPEHSHFKNLETALEILSIYIDKNYANILCPINLPSNKQTTKPTYSKSDFDSLQKNFYGKISMDLNIHSLDRKLFATKKRILPTVEPRSNLQDLRDFYIESIINPY